MNYLIISCKWPTYIYICVVIYVCIYVSMYICISKYIHIQDFCWLIPSLKSITFNILPKTAFVMHHPQNCIFIVTTHLKAWRAWRNRGSLGPTRCRGRVEPVAWPQASVSTSSPATASNTTWLNNSCLRSSECLWSSSACGKSICLLFAAELPNCFVLSVNTKNNGLCKTRARWIMVKNDAWD